MALAATKITTPHSGANSHNYASNLHDDLKSNRGITSNQRKYHSFASRAHSMSGDLAKDSIEYKYRDNKENNKEDHETAARLHGLASEWANSAGLDSVAKHHKKLSEHHKQQAASY